MAREKFIDNLVIEDARIIFRNFSGTQSEFNARGDRNFGLIIPDAETADRLKADGWNVKELQPRDEYSEPTFWIKVKVNMDGPYPPTVFLISGDKRVKLGVDGLSRLDRKDFLIKTCDVIVSPNQWSVNGKSGVKAYLNKIYIVQEVDQLDKKYAEYRDIDELDMAESEFPDE